MRPALLLCLSLMLFACGYRFEDRSLLSRYQTLSMPPIKGDENGRLADALVRELSASGKIRYLPSKGQLRLCVSIVELGRENIGFQFDRDDDDERTRRVVANEGRLKALVDLSLIECASGCTLVGLTRFCAYTDYDFDPLETETGIAVTSLGQFTQIDEAERTALTPLYEELAQKIVDYLSVYW